MGLATRDAPLIYIDASPIYVCCHEDIKTITQLRDYLGDRARVAETVSKEIKQGAEYLTRDLEDPPDAYKDRLQEIHEEGWPQADPEFSEALERELLRRAKALRRLDEPEGKHLGEVATLIQARESGAELVVMDDEGGRSVAARESFQNLELIRSEVLAAEMVAAQALDPQNGFKMAAKANGCSGNAWRQHVAFAQSNA